MKELSGFIILTFTWAKCRNSAGDTTFASRGLLVVTHSDFCLVSKFLLDCSSHRPETEEWGSHLVLKALDTFVYCQRSIFLLGVSQHIVHKITNMREFGLIWTSKLQENIERKKHPRLHKFVCFNAWQSLSQI